ESPGSPLLQQTLGKSSHGLLMLPRGPMLVTARPIITSKGTGPVRGTLIVGRYLGSTQIDSLARLSGVGLELSPIDAPHLSPDLAWARAQLTTGHPKVVRANSADALAGYSVVHDLFGRPALILRAQTQRELFHQQQASAAGLLVALLVVGAGFIG